MPRSPERLLGRTGITPLLVLVLILLLTVAMSLLTARFVRLQQENRFERETEEHAKDLQTQVSIFDYLLRSAQATWSGHGHLPDQATLDRSLKLMQGANRLPGLQGMGITTWQPGTAGASSEAKIWALAPDTPENRRAVGFDMYSEKERRAAIDRSRSDNQPQATPPVNLVQRDGRGQPYLGTLILLPIWAEGSQSKPLGFVYLAVRTSEFMASLQQLGTTASLGIQVTMSGRPLNGATSKTGSFQQNRTLNLLGQPWRLHYTADSSFGRDEAAAFPLLVLLFGLTTAAVAFRLTHAQQLARLRAEALNETLVRARHGEAQSRAEFEAIFQSMQDAAAFTDPEGRIRRSNRAMKQLFGWTDRQLAGAPIAQLHADQRLAHLAPFQALTTPYQRKDGSVFSGEAQRTEVLSPDGAVLGLLEVVRDVTDRVEADQAVRSANQHARDVLDAVPHILWVVDREGQPTYTNRRHQRLLDGAAFEKALHRDDQAQYADMWERARVLDATAQCEVRLYVQERWRWYMIRVTPIMDEVGVVRNWVGSATDIHDRLTAEKIAQRSEERYRGVLEGMPQIVWLTDRKGIPTYFNRQWEQYVGAEQAGTPFVSLLHPDDREEFRHAWAAALDRGEPLEAEHRLLGADGRYRTFVTRSLPIRGPEGHVIEWVGTSTDMDDNVRAEAASRLLADVTTRLIAPGFETPAERHERYAKALSCVTDRFAETAIIWTAPNLTVLAHTRPVPQDLVDRFEGMIDDHVRGVMESGSAVYGEEFGALGAMNLGDGTLLPLQAMKGRIAGVIGIAFRNRMTDRDHELAQDLAQRFGAALEQDALRDAAQTAQDELRQVNQTLEERVQRRTTELQDAVKELEAFSYSVSHDLRTPLRHVVGFGDLLKKETAGTLSPKAERYVNVITEASGKMSQLIDDLLQFSRMGRQELRMQPVDLSSLVQASWQSLEPDRQGRDITFSVAELPTVLGDANLLSLVFVNLLSNAIKYTRRTPQARVTVTAETDGANVTVNVTDNGVGFDPSYASKLFGVFQRLHRAEDFEGIGIGLANVRRIVTRHGGDVQASSRPGEGATFSVTLPLNPVEPNHD